MEQLEQVEIRRKLILYLNPHVQNSFVSLVGKWHICAVLIHCIIACELVFIQAQVFTLVQLDENLLIQKVVDTELYSYQLQQQVAFYSVLYQ